MFGNNFSRIRLTKSSYAQREDLLKTLCKFSIKFSRIDDHQDVCFVHCNEDTDTDSLFTEHCTLALSKVGFTLQNKPVQVKVKCNIFLRNIDKSLYEMADDDFLKEVNSKNSWLEAVAVFKIPKSFILKMTCKNSEMVQKCLDFGLKISYFHVPPRQISREKFVQVLTCFKCYKLDHHTTANCDKEPAYKICSECSSTQHSFRDCGSPQKRCVNCGLKHSSLALKCPQRKNIARLMISNGKNLAHVTNSSDSNHNNCAKGNMSYNLHDDYKRLGDYKILHDYERLDDYKKLDCKRLHMCIVLATMKQHSATAELFEATLNTLFRANNLPDLKLGGVSPPLFSAESPPLFSVETTPIFSAETPPSLDNIPPASTTDCFSFHMRGIGVEKYYLEINF